MRTGLALDAAGLAVLHLLPQLVVPGARTVLGLALVALGALVTVAGYLRWTAYQDALRRSRPLPRTWLPVLLVVTLTLLAATTAVLLVVAQWRE